MTRKEDAKGGQGGRRRNGGRRNGGRRTRGGCDFVEEKRRFHAKKEKDEAQDVIMRNIRRLRMKKMRRRKRRKRRRRKKRGGRE